MKISKKINEKNARNNIKNSQNGITLVALVVTIIVLIILAAVSISLVLGENGIITKAGDAKQNFQRAEEEEKIGLNALFAEMEEKLEGQGSGETPKGPNGKPLINQETISELTTAKIEGEDKLGNQIVIPEGFKLAQGENGSGDTVKDGIVIEDSVGNQYVWIPVSNIDGSSNNPIVIEENGEGNKITTVITLGRYEFATSSPGTPTIKQKGSEYNAVPDKDHLNTTYRIGAFFYELSTHQDSIFSSGLDGTNTTAKDLAGFINSVAQNKGYYIARYEASYRDGGKAGSIESTSTRTDSSTALSAGMLWNFVKQGEAAIACQDLYKISESKTTVNSDLMNSYAWDTAIVYIQAMGNTNYANANRGSNTTLLNTGLTGDVKCKIFDMAGNEWEWTTEYSSYTSTSKAYPCMYRGGGYNNSYNYTNYRDNGSATNSNRNYSFRPALYL